MHSIFVNIQTTHNHPLSSSVPSSPFACQLSKGKPSIKSYQHSHISLGCSSGLLNWLNRLISLLANVRCPNVLVEKDTLQHRMVS
ncbi:hypothetical protein EX217_04455 [Providencia rettgeri]|nr:hypothetical protein [Providencia rettgeri]MBX6974896.1 hypothetical protein [Providencia rettgeri]MBX6994236.1 hypothetical protein [Providencia rettgeri]MBX6998621.1 hypothetical protein [Providencia rettgeri]MBX7019290.1 hypothetical protein [Providencia rettgeri]